MFNLEQTAEAAAGRGTLLAMFLIVLVALPASRLNRPREFMMQEPEFQTAMLAGFPYPGLRDAILTHPTMAEGLSALFENIQQLAAATGN